MRSVALIIWPIFLLISHILFKKAALNSKNHTYSNLGSHDRYGKLFNTTLIVVGLIQLLFLLRIFQINLDLYSSLGMVGNSLLIFTTLAGIITGVIPENKNEKIHLLFGKMGFASAILGYIMYGLYFAQTNVIVTLLMLLFSVIMLYQTYLFLIKETVYAKGESIMFLSAFLTNIALVYLYF